MGEHAMCEENSDDRARKDRRAADRRHAQLSFDGPDRRQGVRRSGADRRTDLGG